MLKQAESEVIISREWTQERMVFSSVKARQDGVAHIKLDDNIDAGCEWTLRVQTSVVLYVYICSYFLLDIDEICVCLYLFISFLACLYNGMFISGYRRLYLDMDLYICSYNRHI